MLGLYIDSDRIAVARRRVDDRFVTRLFQQIFLAVELYACVVSGCDLVAAEKPCTLIAIKIFILLSRSPRESRALRVSCG